MIVFVLQTLLVVSGSVLVYASSPLCSSQTNCLACTTENECGWCGSTSTCVQGTDRGPTSGMCHQYLWNSETCPVPCSAVTSCGKCISSDNEATGIPCGWCSFNNKCSSSSSVCPSLKNWFGLTCPPDTCGESSSCYTCMGSTYSPTGCSWCKSSNTCRYIPDGNTTMCLADGIIRKRSECPVYCSSYSSCGQCLGSSSLGKCGWCSTLSVCLEVKNNEPLGHCPATSSGYSIISQCPSTDMSGSEFDDSSDETTPPPLPPTWEGTRLFALIGGIFAAFGILTLIVVFVLLGRRRRARGEAELLLPPHSSSTDDNDDDQPKTLNLNDNDTSRFILDNTSSKVFGSDFAGVSLANCKIGAQIGGGSYGTVYKAMVEAHNVQIAAKEIKMKNQNDAYREIRRLEKLKHPNIVYFYGHDVDIEKQVVWVFMEYLAGGSLRSALDGFGKMDPKQASAYTKQIVQGLHFLHKKGFSHRDIKADNLLLDTKGTLKLADFGTAVSNATVATYCGTSAWMAPEVVQGSPEANSPADVWALGCTVMELLGGVSHPFAWLGNARRVEMTVGASKSSDEIKAALKGGEELLKTRSAEGWDFIQLCCTWSPVERPTMKELMTHRFLKLAK